MVSAHLSDASKGLLTLMCIPFRESILTDAEAGMGWLSRALKPGSGGCRPVHVKHLLLRSAYCHLNYELVSCC